MVESAQEAIEQVPFPTIALSVVIFLSASVLVPQILPFPRAIQKMGATISKVKIQCGDSISFSIGSLLTTISFGVILMIQSQLQAF